MVGRRRKSPRKLAASPQRSWLWGRHAVIETLAADRWRPHEVRIAERQEAAVKSLVREACARHGITCTEHSSEQLTRWCGTGEHQGLLAQMPPYPYLSVEIALRSLNPAALVLILEGIQDPHNFGAILRSADVFGVDVVFVGERSQCEVTPHVARSSAGAVNHVPISRVAELTTLPQLLKLNSGIRTFAATGTANVTAFEMDLSAPAAIVIGNEGEGVSPALLSACAGTIRIPQRGHVNSLNAAVAAGVLLYEVQRQRGFTG